MAARKRLTELVSAPILRFWWVTRIIGQGNNTSQMRSTATNTLNEQKSSGWVFLFIFRFFSRSWRRSCYYPVELMGIVSLCSRQTNDDLANLDVPPVDKSANLLRKLKINGLVKSGLFTFRAQIDLQFDRKLTSTWCTKIASLQRKSRTRLHPTFFLANSCRQWQTWEVTDFYADPSAACLINAELHGWQASPDGFCMMNIRIV